MVIASPLEFQNGGFGFGAKEPIYGEFKAVLIQAALERFDGIVRAGLAIVAAQDGHCVAANLGAGARSRYLHEESPLVYGAEAVLLTLISTGSA